MLRISFINMRRRHLTFQFSLFTFQFGILVSIKILKEALFVVLAQWDILAIV